MTAPFRTILRHAVGRGLWNSRSLIIRKLSSAPENVAEPINIPYATLRELGDELLYPFNETKTLATAMLHKSIVNDSIDHKVFAEVRPGVVTRLHDNNEKLEVLGDKVFGLLIVDYLMRKDKSLSEGQISKAVHSIASRKSADYFCRTLSIDRFLIAASHISESPRSSMRGNFFEALLGAIFQDGGYAAAEEFFNARVTTLFQPHHIHQKTVQRVDQKSKLQEHLVQFGLPATKLGTVLQYVPVSNSLNNGRQSFTQAIHLFGHRLSVGTSPTKTGADKNAAQKLLSSLEKNGSTTCIIIRLARAASDKETLLKAQGVRQQLGKSVCASEAEGITTASTVEELGL